MKNDSKPRSGIYESFSQHNEWDELTPIKTVCLACKGRWKSAVDPSRVDTTMYRLVTCKWCIEGCMTGEQVNRWVNKMQRVK